MVYRALRGVVAPVVVIVFVLALALVPAVPAAAAGHGPAVTGLDPSEDDIPAFWQAMGAELDSDGELTAESTWGSSSDTDLGPGIDPNG